jgi:hypothetical protein
MKAQWLLIILGAALGAVLGQNHVVSGKQSASPSPSMTIRGEVANIRIVQGSINIELGGSWRRRFVVVINETDVLIPYSDVIKRFRNRMIEVDGLVFENRGRFEVHIDDLDKITLLDRESEDANQPSPPTLVSTSWPGDFNSLAKEINKLRREITDLKRIQQEQQHILDRLKVPSQPKTTSPQQDRDYRDLEHRVHRIEVALDLVVQAVR